MGSLTALTLENELQRLRVAIVHHWFIKPGGAENVVAALGEMFPQADIYTLVANDSAVPAALRSHGIYRSFVQRLPGSRTHHRLFLPLYPFALEQFDLDKYDLIISSESGPSKGVLTGPSACHICYCHTPMRYVWHMYQPYRRSAPLGFLGRAFYSLTSHYVRQWDYASAARVDHFVASSANGARRIQKYYRRDAEVIYPPVNVGSFSVSNEPRRFYLVVSRLVSYKRIDLAVRACTQLRRDLVIIGKGEELDALRRIAGPTVTFLGPQSDDSIREHYRCCRALLFPGEEDIGLVPIEAQASGRPVIAYSRGGALETVNGLEVGCPFRPDATGVLFDHQSPESIIEAILYFESIERAFDPLRIRENAQRFDTSQFREQMYAFVAQCLGLLSEFPEPTSGESVAARTGS